MSDKDARLSALEGRLQSLEDQVSLYQLMSAYGPLVDSGDAEAVAALWVEDGSYDWGGGPGGHLHGKEEVHGAAWNKAAIADMVRGSGHQGVIHNGSGHVIGLPHIVVTGDEAVATTYSRLYRHDGRNFEVWMVSANRWEFVRTATGWRVKRRVNRLLNGGDAPRQLLRSGIS